MTKAEFIKRMMELFMELDKASDGFSILMISNDINLLYDRHIEEIKQSVYNKVR